MPSETAAASPAVASDQCTAPTSPGLWHEAQFARSNGITVFLNDGPCACFAFSVGVGIVVGTENFVGSIAVRCIVSVTSSDVLTSPATLIGPTPKRDIFVCAVATAVSLPLEVLAVT